MLMADIIVTRVSAPEKKTFHRSISPDYFETECLNLTHSHTIRYRFYCTLHSNQHHDEYRNESRYIPPDLSVICVQPPAAGWRLTTEQGKIIQIRKRWPSMASTQLGSRTVIQQRRTALSTPLGDRKF